MKQQLMNTLMERFRDGGGMSERTVKLHGSSIERIRAMFSGNQYVTVAEKTIGGTKYVVGRIRIPTKKIVMLEPTVFNNNAKYDNKYMAEKLSGQEGDC